MSRRRQGGIYKILNDYFGRLRGRFERGEDLKGGTSIMSGRDALGIHINYPVIKISLSRH